MEKLLTFDAAVKIVTKDQVKLNFPFFKTGDTVVVSQQIFEGKKSRIQRFQGVVLKRSGSGINEVFLVRRDSGGFAVEKSFPLCSPLIKQIEVLRAGRVRRNYISYLRGLTGKKAYVKLDKARVFKPAGR